MTRLYVDDVRPAPPGYDIARSADEAREMMKLRSYDEVSLDHDLGACGPCVADPSTGAAATLGCPHVENGRTLLVWMLLRGCSPERITVHSTNPDGRQAMLREIEAARARNAEIILLTWKRAHGFLW